MLFFGHIGITVGVVQAINHATKRKVDLRKVAVLAILPDLLDKPVGLLYRVSLGNHTRLWAHSILFTLVFYVLMKLMRKKFRYPAILAGAYLGHMVLDRVWLSDWYALLWPVFPFPEPIPDDILVRWGQALTQPWTVFGEVLGLAILYFLYGHYQLRDRRRLVGFWKTGNLVAVREKPDSDSHFSLPI